VSSPERERLAARRADRAHAIRRRRAGAVLSLAVLVVVIALLASGGSGRHRTTRARGHARAAASHVVVSESGQLPAAVQDAAAAPSGATGVLLAGGLDSAETSVTDVVGVEGATTHPLEALPTALHDACASALNGAVYVFGGGQSSSFSQIVRLEDTGAAQAAGSLPTPASDVACASVGGAVYIVGGYTGQEPLRTIVAWRPGETPKVAASLPKPLRYAAVGQIGGQILIAGGTSGVQVSRDVYRFDPQTGVVQRLAQLPYPVTHAAGAPLGGALLVIGGRTTLTGSQTNEVLAVSPEGTVSVAGTLPRALSDIAAAQSGERVIAAGGQDATGHTQAAIFTITQGR
jgi:hypothetical protein